nr:hypothetical protein [Tanacetum cinerariifolium]
MDGTGRKIRKNNEKYQMPIEYEKDPTLFSIKLHHARKFKELDKMKYVKGVVIEELPSSSMIPKIGLLLKYHKPSSTPHVTPSPTTTVNPTPTSNTTAIVTPSPTPTCNPSPIVTPSHASNATPSPSKRKFTKNNANRKTNVNDIEPVPFLANVNVQDPEPLAGKANTNENETVESIIQELMPMNYEIVPFEDIMTASLNDQPSVNEHKKARDDNNEPEETLVEGETVVEDEEDSSTEEGDGDLEDEEDYFVDEDTYLEEVNIDMADYHFNIDEELEWVRHSNDGQEQDHDPIPAEVKERVRLHSIETRRKLFLAKNYKVRIRAKCLGIIPMFIVDGEGPSNTEALAPRKKTTKVKGKKDVGPIDPVGLNKKGVSLGGRGRPKPLAADECPWALQITKVKNTKTWEVRTYTDEHKCLQSREIHAYTSNFLSKGIVDQIEKNPGILVKALQVELQKKYELKLRRANPDTIIKIEVERDSDTELNTRVFKRICICLGPLEKGFMACGRDFLGFDGVFMNGPYPGQLVTAVGLDGNNGIYPLAYAIVEKETTCSWTWFLECLGDDLGMTKEYIFTFISDRQKGLAIAMANVFPCAEHRYYLRHIHETRVTQPCLDNQSITLLILLMKFKELEKMKYVNGLVAYVDGLDIDKFSVHDLNQVMVKLGYVNNDDPIYYHYMILGTDLEIGLRALVVEDEEDSSSTEEGDSDSEDDEDYFVDEDTYFEEVNVYMADYHFNIDAEVKRVMHSNGGQEQDHDPIPSELDVIDNDNFKSGTDSEDDGIVKTEVKERVRLHSIKTRRNLFLAKNDKVRIRVKCLGRIHVFTLDCEGPSNTEEVAPRKKTTKDKGKKDVGLSDPVGPNKKGVSLGGRGRPKPLAADECPWALQITKVKNTKTWEVRTYTDEHKCLQSREIHACTSKFFSKGVSRQKAFRAKSAALNQYKGDYSQQYTMLRDYCLELRRANPDTTIKIKVERDSDIKLNTRLFKRIYICLGPLKKGFKACGRDLLGLDGALIKGPYPGQLLTDVGLDGNNGIYPLAYSIVKKETTCSWTWFLECLGDDLGMTKEYNFTFISDRKK